uniref:Uncharacterized protein n=1 Tax=Quercus lobata TaxID=97700 RepID=A0A7N2R3H9_QUELO
MMGSSCNVLSLEVDWVSGDGVNGKFRLGTVPVVELVRDFLFHLLTVYVNIKYVIVLNMPIGSCLLSRGEGNGGEVDYQYGDSLRTMGGRPRSFSPRNTHDSARAAKEQTTKESTNYSLMQGTSPAAGLESTNPSKQVEADSEILGDSPIFQEGDDVDMKGKAYVLKGNSLRMVSGPNFKGDDVE